MKTSENALRVVLADDHHFFREGLREMLATEGMVVVGEAADGAGAVALARELAPDVIVIDLDMPSASSIDALRQIVLASPDAQLVVLTVSADETDVLEALAAGACGYLLKNTRVDELVGGIRLAAGGHAVLSRDVVRALVARVRADNHAAEQASGNGLALTARELEVIQLITAGADNATIGRELSISKHTVKQYVTNIFEKLGVQSRVQAAVYAVRNGLV
jgi:two-component system, NarL family, nitrate/nitrite response regulator NarL